VVDTPASCATASCCSGLATIEVLHNHHAERIRLNGIDCLENGHADFIK
jgi:hypothetical protein